MNSDPPNPVNRRADWIAWSLHFALGFFVGWVLGWGSDARNMRREGLPWGLALLLAGLASLYGDRLWLRSSYRVVPPRDIEHSKVSRFVSTAACVTGGFLVVKAILFRLGAF